MIERMFRSFIELGDVLVGSASRASPADAAAKQSFGERLSQATGPVDLVVKSSNAAKWHVVFAGFVEFVIPMRSQARQMDGLSVQINKPRSLGTSKLRHLLPSSQDRGETQRHGGHGDRSEAYPVFSVSL